MAVELLKVPRSSRAALSPAGRAGVLATEAAFGVGARATELAASGANVVRLEIGQPDWGAPDVAIEAAVRALRDGDAGYAPPSGLPALRAAIAARSAERGVPLDPSRIQVLPGAKPGLYFAAQLLLEPGDEALVPDPGFPIYPSVVRAAGALPVSYPPGDETDFALDADCIEAALTERTRVVFINAPHNPTGAIIRRTALERLAELALSHGFTIVSDEVYQDLHFEGRQTSLGAFREIADRTILVDSLSKRFGMTGWRLGWAVVPEHLVEAFERLTINTVSCVPPFIQRGGIAALNEPVAALEERVRQLRAKRDFLVSGLRTIDGVQCASPPAGFYAFPSITGLADRIVSRDAAPAAQRFAATEIIATRLLEEHAVATLPGTGFGAGGTGYLRLSFATSHTHLEAAVARLRAFAAGLESHG